MTNSWACNLFLIHSENCMERLLCVETASELGTVPPPEAPWQEFPPLVREQQLGAVTQRRIRVLPGCAWDCRSRGWGQTTGWVCRVHPRTVSRWGKPSNEEQKTSDPVSSKWNTVLKARRVWGWWATCNQSQEKERTRPLWTEGSLSPSLVGSGLGHWGQPTFPFRRKLHHGWGQIPEG